MHIYFIGIGGVAIGPLARLARDAGHTVSGSDTVSSRYTEGIKRDGIPVQTGATGTDAIASVHSQRPIDWVVYTSAVPADSAELSFARDRGIRTSKRDVLINHILEQQNLKMVAVAGTHGKTTTTGMLVWLAQKLKKPVSYSVGTHIPFGPNGLYHRDSEYFIYEADEFDRNFLNFNPEFTLLPSVDYDHPDTYPTVEEYKQAFRDFVDNSGHTLTWKSVADYLGLQASEKITIVPDETDISDIRLPGNHTRKNAYLAANLAEQLFGTKRKKIIEKLNEFPGTERRMELLADKVYSDYAHHPSEIKASVKAALEMSDRVVVVYQPHQNKRQSELMREYGDSFKGVERVLWLPTYLSRESAENIISPDELIRHLTDPTIAEKADLNDDLFDSINRYRTGGAIVILMSAGDLDSWARDRFHK